MKRDLEKARAWERRLRKPLKSNAQKAWDWIMGFKPKSAADRERALRSWKKKYGSRERLAWLHSQYCDVPGCENREIEATHTPSVGAGGTADNMSPLCWWHHKEQHQIGVASFDAKYGVDMRKRGAYWARRWSHTEGGRE